MPATAPVVSVITPFRDVAPYLGQAIDSVLAQSFEDWELLLVDDGSGDASGAIAEGYAARHPGRIFVLRHPGGENRGISASRNLGRRHARGTWIASLDGDDVWLPQTLAGQTSLAARHPEAGLILGATRYWRSWAGADAAPYETVPVGAPEGLHRPPELLHRLYPLGEGAAPSMNTVFVRADVLEAVGGWEDAFRTAYEDQALLTKLYLATPVYVSHECRDLYRQRPGSIMSADLTGDDYITHRLRFLRWLESHMREQGLEGTPEHEAARRALRACDPAFFARAERVGRRALARVKRLVRS
jgi:glycosyltransferase involved in cell wall biosynthesis